MDILFLITMHNWGTPNLGFLKQILELSDQKGSYVEKKGWEGSKVSPTVGIGR